MAAFIQDTFVNTSGTTVNLNGRPADVGGTWRYTPSRLGSGTGIPQVYPEQHVRSASLNRQIAYNDLLPSAANVRITASLGRFTDVSTSQAGLAFCVNPATDTCYYIRWNNLACVLFKLTNNTTNTQLATTPSNAATFGLPFPGPIAAEVTYSDGLISVYRNGALILTYTDPSPLPLGFVGLTVSGTGYVDNFAAEALGNLPTPTTGTASAGATVTGQTLQTRVTTATAAGSASGVAISFKFQTGFGRSDSAAEVTGVAVLLTTVSATAVAAGIAESAFEGFAGGIREAVGTSAGSSTSLIDTDLTAAATGSSAGLAQVFGTARPIGTSTGVSNGVGTVSGATSDFGSSVGVAAGTSTGAFFGAATRAASFAVAGTSTVTGLLFSGGSFRVEGSATVQGRGSAVGSAEAQASGTSGSVFRSEGVVAVFGMAEGSAVGDGVGHQIIETEARSDGVADSFVYSFGIQVFPVNPDRVLLLPAEERLVTLRAEDRLIRLPRAVLGAVTETQTRTVVLAAEDFGVVLAAEDFTVTLAAEDRIVVL